MFDVFLSYKSEDAEAVIRIRKALEARGARVWVDHDQIRPGDHFAAALESGLETSRSVALVVTPRSVRSPWVKEEYYRALSLANEGRLNLIPVLLEDAPLPGFLSTRQYVSIRGQDEFDLGMDRLMWPGVTGKQIAAWAMFGRPYSERWKTLFRVSEAAGISFAGGEDIHRSEWHLQEILDGKPARRVVVFVDPFEERPAETTIWRNTVAQYLDAIRDLRERTRGGPNEVVFVLYIQKNAWDAVAEVKDLPSELVRRMRHYYTLPQDIPSDAELRNALVGVWQQAQRDLMLQEHVIG